MSHEDEYLSVEELIEIQKEETRDIIAALLEDGSDPDSLYEIEHHLFAEDFDTLEKAVVEAFKMGFEVLEAEETEDEDGNKTSEVLGIRSACKVMKTRYAKPFESVQIKIPYSTGMNPYSGLIDMFEAQGILKKDGNRLAYTSPVTGEIIKEFRKNFTDEQLNQMME